MIRAGILLLFVGITLQAQTTDWNAIVRKGYLQRFPAARISQAEKTLVARLLIASDTSLCNDDITWTQGLSYETIPLGASRAMLVKPRGLSCTNGGVANGTMWLIGWRGPKPVLLGEFDGWFYNVQGSSSHGLRNVTVAHHMGAALFILTLFRFDGTRYRETDTADVVCEPDGGSICVPHPKAPLRDHR